jgi:subtilisin family serine protease
MRISRKIPKNILSLLLAICLLFPVAYPTPIFSDSAASVPEGEPAPAFDESTDCVPGEILVVFNENVSEPAAEAVIEASDGALLGISDALGGDAPVALVELPSDMTVGEALEEFSQNALVEFAQPNYIYTFADDEEILPTAVSVNDPYAANQWHLGSIGAAEAWELLPAGNAPVRVAVLDDNVFANHADLATNVLLDLARDFSDGTEKPRRASDYGGHGTHVSGIIGATANNGLGIAGVADNVARIIPVNVFSPEGSATSAGLVGAIGYALKADAKVINMSLGYSGTSDSYLGNAVSTAISSGVTVVCASGNRIDNLVPPFPNLPSDFNIPGVAAS